MHKMDDLLRRKSPDYKMPSNLCKRKMKNGCSYLTLHIIISVSLSFRRLCWHGRNRAPTDTKGTECMYSLGRANCSALSLFASTGMVIHGAACNVPFNPKTDVMWFLTWLQAMCVCTCISNTPSSSYNKLMLSKNEVFHSKMRHSPFRKVIHRIITDMKAKFIMDCLTSYWF